MLLFGGSVADRIGSKNAHRAGMALFALASLLCGLAPNLPMLIATRLVQRAGAGLVTPASLSLIREALEGARERRPGHCPVGSRRLGSRGNRPLLGGVLVQADWRLIFFINMPVAAMALAELA